MDNIGLLLLLQIFLILLNAIFASAEIAVLSVNEAKIEAMAENGNKRAQRLLKLMKQPEKFLSTIQIAITLSGFLGSAFAAENFADPLAEWLLGLGVPMSSASLETVMVVLITLILSYFTLIFGELVPKRVAMKKSEELALAYSGIIGAISTAFKPVVYSLSFSTNAVLRMCGIDPKEEEETVSEEDIRMMVKASGDKGAIDKEEQEFIQNVFEFDDLNAGEIATHRTDVMALWMEDSDEEWDRIIHEYHYSNYPICGSSTDDVLGVLSTSKYFRLREKNRGRIMAEAVSPAFFVPQSIKADVLFRNMKKERVSFAVVLDEYGGMAGIITLSDLVEELVGDLSMDEDKAENVEPHIEKINDYSWKIYGNATLSDIKDATGLDISSPSFDTFTGVVFDRLSAVPKDGKQQITVEFQGFAVQINEIFEHQLHEAILFKRTENRSPEAKDK